MPELVGDAGYAQEPGLLSLAKEGAQTQWAVLTGGIDHDADIYRVHALPPSAVSPNASLAQTSGSQWS